MPTTLTHYRQVLDAVLARGIPFERDSLTAYLASRQDGRPCKPGTHNHRRVILRAFCQYLCREGALSSDPTQTIGRARVPRLKRSALRPDELSQVLATLRTEPATWRRSRDEALFMLLFYAGLRVSEAQQLDLPQVLAEHRIVRDVVHKGGDRSDVVLHPLVATALYHWLLDRPPASCDAVFINKYGRRISVRGIEKRFSQLGERAGLGKRLHPHALRHAHATALLRLGVPTATIQQSLNHRSISTTETYLHSDDDMLSAAIARLPDIEPKAEQPP